MSHSQKRAKTMNSKRSCLFLLCWIAVALPASAQDGEFLRDPEWRKRFLGSYGFLSGAEPDIRQDELALLREVIDVMQVDPKVAATRLQGATSDTSSAALDFILANLRFQSGDLEPAVASYRTALQKFPDFRRAHKNLGLLLVQKSDCKAAAKHLTRAVELGDRDGRNYGLLGYCYIQLENPLAAESAYRSAILQEPETQDWKLGLAQALLGMEKYAEAAAHFESLLTETPGDPQLWKLQANAFVGLDRPLDAAVNLETVRLLGKAETSSLVLLGDIYMNAGMPEFASDAYLAVIEQDRQGTQFQAAYRAADLLIRTGAYRQADSVLAKIDSRYESLPRERELQVLTLKAKSARAQGQSGEAAKLLESIVSRDGTRGEALLELARHYRDQGAHEKALLMLERARNLDGFEYPALLDGAQLHVSSGDYGKAVDLLRQAVQIKREPRVERFLARVEEAARG